MIGGSDDPQPHPVDASSAVIAVALVELQRASYALEAALIGDDRIPTMHESVEDLRHTPLAWLAMSDADGIVAAIAYSETQEEIEIDRLMVAPRTLRRGYGRRLVAEVLRRAGRRPVRVSTGRDNTPAVALYESLGFIKCGEREPVPGLLTTQFLWKAGVAADRMPADPNPTVIGHDVHEETIAGQDPHPAG